MSSLLNDDVPLGMKYYNNSTHITEAINDYLLSPYQYSITRFDFDGNNKHIIDNGLKYNTNGTNGLNYLRATNTKVNRSENDFSAQSYDRFESDDGEFNPLQTTLNNKDLWNNGANLIKRDFGLGGADLTPQVTEHIIFPEVQRGGLNSTSLAKYSWNNELINNDENCKFFDYKYSNSRKVVFHDSDYVRKIGISRPDSGSMPFNINY